MAFRCGFNPYFLESWKVQDYILFDLFIFFLSWLLSWLWPWLVSLTLLPASCVWPHLILTTLLLLFLTDLPAWSWFWLLTLLLVSLNCQDMPVHLELLLSYWYLCTIKTSPAHLGCLLPCWQCRMVKSPSSASSTQIFGQVHSWKHMLLWSPPSGVLCTQEQGLWHFGLWPGTWKLYILGPTKFPWKTFKWPN